VLDLRFTVDFPEEKRPGSAHENYKDKKKEQKKSYNRMVL